VDQVHEFMDRVGSVHRGPAAVVVLGSSASGRSGDSELRPRDGGGERRAGELKDGVVVVRETVEGRLTSGGASARKGDGGGMLRAKRRSVGGVGIFTEGGATFYRAEVRWGRPGAFNGRR
jgi:hypothetical protein